MSAAVATINLRARPEQKTLIERAADAIGVNRTQFMLEASVQRAESVLADRSRFVLSDEKFTEFVQALEAPLAKPEAVRRLLARRTRWHTE